MTDHIIFGKTYISSCYSKSPKMTASVCVCGGDRETDRKEGLEQRLAEDCYIKYFLNHVVILYSRSYVIPSLTRCSQPGPGCHPSGKPPTALLTALSPSDSLTDG